MTLWLLTLPASAGTIALEDVSRAVAGVVGADPPKSGDGVQGVAWLDYDSDGDLDLFHTNGPGLPSLLFRNDGDGRFAEVAGEVGLAVTSGSSAVLAADLDGDGDTDLLLLGDGNFYRRQPTPSRLFRNDGGTFTDVTGISGISALLPPTCAVAAAGDIDHDDDLDLYIGAPGSIVWRRDDSDVLLRNDGGRFVDVSASSGVGGAHGACAAAFVHADADDNLDLFVAGCSEVNYVPNPLWLFTGDGVGAFVDTHVAARLWATGWFMSATLGDVDGDGRLDLFATNLGAARGAPDVLYVQRPDGTYADRTVDGGISELGFGWGASAVDLDNDGALDLYFAGSPVVAANAADASPGVALHNRGDGTFDQVPQPFDLSDRATLGLAAADYDDDGRLDIAIASGRDVTTFAPSAPILLHNVGAVGSWLTVRLVGDLPNADGVGARIRATLPDGRVVRRDVIAGSSFASTESPWPTFGLGDAAQADLEVTWPDGEVEAFGTFAPGQRVELARGAGQPPPALVQPVPVRSPGCATASGGRAPWAAALALLWLCGPVPSRARGRASRRADRDATPTAGATPGR